MVQGEPLITVLLATHNGSRFILEAVRSVLAQTYRNFECLVVDDASQDATAALVVSAGDDRIRVIRNERRLGLTASLNKGLEEASGEFVARIDDDDVWPDRDKLRRQVQYMQRYPDVGVCGTQNSVIDVRGRELYRWHVETADRDIRRHFLARNQFVHSGVLIRRSALATVGTYDERRRYAQDYELWLRIGRKYKLGNLPDVYIKQRINPRGVTSRHSMRQFFSFFSAAWMYRRDYPGFWSNLPIYAQGFLINLLPKPLFYRIGPAWRQYRQ